MDPMIATRGSLIFHYPFCSIPTFNRVVLNTRRANNISQLRVPQSRASARCTGPGRPLRTAPRGRLLARDRPPTKKCEAGARRGTWRRRRICGRCLAVPRDRLAGARPAPTTPITGCDVARQTGRLAERPLDRVPADRVPLVRLRGLARDHVPASAPDHERCHTSRAGD